MKFKLIKKSVVSMNRMLNAVTHILPLIVIYFAIGKQKLAAHHLVVTMRPGKAAPSSVLIEKSVSMMSSVLNLNNQNRCAFVNQVFF